MEKYIEIINIDQYFFYEGDVTLKYRGAYNRYLSEKENIDHYRHQEYYDVVITNPIQLSSEEFKQKEILFQLRNIRNDEITVHRIDKQTGEKKYRIDVDVLYFEQGQKATHVQTEDDILHGDFTNAKAIFKMRRPELAFRCKANVETGKREQREDGEYIEVTTGKYLDELQDCEKIWVKVGENPPCPKDTLTGNKEEEDTRYRFEYYSGERNENGECATYWGEWIEKPKEPEAQEPGSTSSPVLTPPTSTRWGCLSIVFWFLAILWAIFCMSKAVALHNFIPILFGIGIPLLLASLGYLINFFGRFSLGITRFYRWIANLLLLLIILFILNTILTYVYDDGPSNDRVIVPQDTSWSSQNVEVVDPYTTWDSSNENEAERQLRYKLISLKWSDYNGNKYKGRFKVYESDIRASESNLKQINPNSIRSYREVYNDVYSQDRMALNDLYAMLDSIRRHNSLHRNEFASVIVSMVQTLDYTIVLDKSCNDPSMRNNRAIAEMLEAGYRCEGEAPFGIKAPVEFITSLSGDCDTRTVFLYTVLKHFKYDVVILNSAYYAHSMLGLALPEVNGAYKIFNGKKYYFWETTSEGYPIGVMDSELRNMNYWKVELN